MKQQMSFAQSEYAWKKKVRRRERFLGEMERVVRLETAKAQVRARVEHPFHIIKNLFRHRKTRYRGLAKNTAQLHSLFALANLVIARRLLPSAESV